MNNTELLPCPFCWSPATPPNAFGKVSCSNDWEKCNMALWGMHWRAWNTRAEKSAPVERIELTILKESIAKAGHLTPEDDPTNYMGERVHIQPLFEASKAYLKLQGGG